jgi:hypothetical protein
VLFAKRKRNIFKGPMLAFGGGSSSRSTGSGSHSRSASASGLGRRSGEITIQEVDEDDGDAEDEIEEVDAFSPVISRPGERVEERIFEEGEAVTQGEEGKGKEKSAGTLAPLIALTAR